MNNIALYRIYSFKFILIFLCFFSIGANGEVSKSVTFNYTSEGRLESVDGPRVDVNDVISIIYDDVGFVKRVTMPGGRYIENEEFNSSGKATKISDSNGLITEFIYDSNDRLMQVMTYGQDLSLARITRYEYTSLGEIEKIFKSTGEEKYFEYDDARRINAVMDGEGNRIDFDLDGAGNISAIRKSNVSGDVTLSLTKVYDELNRIRSINGSDGKSLFYDYDVNSNIVSESDVDDNFTEYEYDGLDRVVKKVSPDGDDVRFLYNEKNAIKKIIDSKGYETIFDRDHGDNIKNTINSETGIKYFEYDSAGNLIKSVDGRGIVTSYSYTESNQVSEIVYDEVGDEMVNYKYYLHGEENGRDGRVKEVESDGNKIIYQYNEFGDIGSVHNNYDAFESHVDYQYDSGGHKISEYRSGLGYIRYARDGFGKVSEIVIDSDIYDIDLVIANQFSYLPFGGLKSFKSGNGLQNLSEFSLEENIESISVVGSELIHGRNYFYDNKNRIKSYVDAHSADKSTVVEYTPGGRVGLYERGDDKTIISYDENGNRKKHSKVNSSGDVVSTYEYSDGSNLLSKIIIDSDPYEINFEYDLNGNLIKKTTGSNNQKVEVFEYGKNNRLIKYSNSDSGLEVTYSYNGLGQRVRKSLSNGESYTFIFDQNNNLMRRVSLHNNIIRDYVYFDDRLIAMVEHNESSASIYYVHVNHLLTPTLLTNQAGSEIWAADLDVFGFHAEGLNGFKFNIRFPGQYYDEESGLHYNYFRDYDPKIGRYIQADPLGLADGINQYNYVDGNPLSYIDPNGLSGLNVLSNLFDLADNLSTLNDARGITQGLIKLNDISNADALCTRPPTDKEIRDAGIDISEDIINAIAIPIPFMNLIDKKRPSLLDTIGDSVTDHERYVIPVVCEAFPTKELCLDHY